MEKEEIIKQLQNLENIEKIYSGNSEMALPVAIDTLLLNLAKKDIKIIDNVVFFEPFLPVVENYNKVETKILASIIKIFFSKVKNKTNNIVYINSVHYNSKKNCLIITVHEWDYKPEALSEKVFDTLKTNLKV